VEVDPKRFYPLGAAAPHVLGYLSESTQEQVRRENLLPGQRVGQTGVELAFDQRLRGMSGILLEEVNARGRPLRTVDTMKAVRHGTSLRFTLDARMQATLAEAFGDEAGAAVFLDPRSGAIRALYSGPSFDPNLFSGRLSSEQWRVLSEDPRRPLLNRAVSSVYSPGSTFKIVMAAAALGEGVLERDERVYCGGYKVFYGRRRHCHFRGGHGWMDLESAITKSCNVFFYTAGQRLGIEAIEDWSRRFGLGASTGVPLTAEAPGLVPSDEWKRARYGEPWYPGETISVAIGQGPLLVTPLQMSVVAAIIANGGHLVHPFVEAGLVDESRPEPLGIAEETLARVRRGMVDVVESGRGTARRARVEGMQVAGKTGTAQVVALDAEEDPGDHAWFIGFAPVDDPRLAFAIIVEHAGHGGAKAAPIAATVLEEWLDRNPIERPADPERMEARRGGTAVVLAGGPR
jgi:penicillin-binding protein 2